MPPFLVRLLILFAPVALAGCNLANDEVEETGSPADLTREDADDAEAGVTAEAAVEEDDAMVADGTNVVTEPKPDDLPADPPQYHIDEEELSFAYGWPSRMARYSRLRARFREDAEAKLAEMRQQMAEDERLIDPDAEFRPQYSSETSWSIEGENARLASLAADWYSFSGGAHGLYGREALLLDKWRGRPFAPVELFEDEEAAREAIRPPYCRLLDAERERRRGQPVEREDSFGECIDPLEQTLIFANSGEGVPFDRFTVYAGPYAAGPYAEGEYAVDMPVTEQLIAAIEPWLRRHFAVSEEEGHVEPRD
jgi:hypothetical protein